MKDNVLVEKIGNGRFIFMTLLIIECFVKNIPSLIFGKYAILFICFLTLLLLLYRALFFPNMLFGKKHIVKYLLIVTIVLSSVINNSIKDYNNVVVLVTFIILLFLVDNFDEKENLNSVMNEFVIIARFTTLLHLFYSIASLINAICESTFNIAGLIGLSNFYAYNCVTVIGLLVFLLLFDKSIYLRAFDAVNLSFHILILFFTQLRSAFIGMFFAILIIIYLLLSNGIVKFNLSKFIRYCATVMIIYLGLAYLLSRFTSVDYSWVIKKITTFTISGREIIWPVTIACFLTGNLVFGFSYSKLPIVFANYIDNVLNVSTDSNNYYAYWIAKQGTSVHNIYLQQLCAHGTIGFVLMAIYVIDIVKKYFLIIKSSFIHNFDVFCLLSCFAFTIFAQFFISFFDNNLFFNIIYISNILFFYSAGMIRFIVNRVDNNDK